MPLVLRDLRTGELFLAEEKDGLVEIAGLGMVPKGKLEPGKRIRLAGRELLVRPPLPEDLPRILRRGAQFNSPLVSYYMIMKAGIGPGSFVVEAGAGSGGLTSLLLGLIGEGGRLVSYERRGDFARILRRNVESLGLASKWELKVMDFSEADERDADALLVDLPEPWGYVDVFRRVLKPGGRICAHCMSINQAWKTHLSLQGGGFVEVQTSEVLERNWVVDERRLRPDFEMLGHHGFVVCGTKEER